MKMNLPLPTPEEAQQWANVLRSGKYKQGRMRLRTIEKKFCCLGVLCDIYKMDDNYMEAHVYPERHKNLPDWVVRVDSALRRYFPRLSVTLRVQFMGSESGIIHTVGDSLYISEVGFTTLNDALKFTFDEIADIIELVFVHKVLDDESEGNKQIDKL